MSTVALHSGEQVDSASEAWRAECEARFALRMSFDRRTRYLAAVHQMRGEIAHARLVDTMNALRRATTTEERNA